MSLFFCLCEKSLFNVILITSMKLNYIKNWLPVILWAGMIFFLSSIPDLRSGLPNIFDLILRKIAHSGEFGVLAILIMRAISSLKQQHNRKLSFNVILIVIIIVILYAISDELHQGFVPGRVTSPIDALIDSFGAIIGLVIFLPLQQFSRMS